MSKVFESFVPDERIARRELQELEVHLNAKIELSEGPDCQEFLERRRHLAAWLGGYASTFFKPDRLAFRLKLFDDFACDIAIADTRRRRYCFVELEDAVRGSIFNAKVRRLRPPWGSRLEGAISQVTDWSWQVQRHRNSQVFLDIFGSFDVQISYLIVIGRDAFIDAADRGRYSHRQSGMTIGQSTISIVTYDEARADIADRLGIESAVMSDPRVLD